MEPLWTSESPVSRTRALAVSGRPGSPGASADQQRGPGLAQPPGGQPSASGKATMALAMALLARAACLSDWFAWLSLGRVFFTSLASCLADGRLVCLGKGLSE